jgi:hypothetical protein
VCDKKEAEEERVEERERARGRSFLLILPLFASSIAFHSQSLITHKSQPHTHNFQLRLELIERERERERVRERKRERYEEQRETEEMSFCLPNAQTHPRTCMHARTHSVVVL